MIYGCPFVYEGHIPTGVVNNVQVQCQDNQAPAETKSTLFLWPRRLHSYTDAPYVSEAILFLWNIR